MAAVEAGFEESLFQACNSINLEIVFVRIGQKEVIRNIGKSFCFFQLLPFVFDSWNGSTESFTFVVSPLNARSDREAKRFACQLSNGSEY